MIGNASWIFIVIIGAIVGIYYLHKQGKIPWLKGRSLGLGMKIPRLKIFEPKPDARVKWLKAQTEKERVKTVELQELLVAKEELAKIKAENIQLLKQIESVSAYSVLDKKKSVQQAEKDAQDAEAEAGKRKPKRL